jgi:hypothetical protein
MRFFCVIQVCAEASLVFPLIVAETFAKDFQPSTTSEAAEAAEAETAEAGGDGDSGDTIVAPKSE